MKSVLISIRPQWCEKIASGKKTVEVRKSMPGLERPFKCYIYMSQGDLKDLGSYSEWIYKNRMKVIGEFVCDKIYTYYADDFVGSEDFDGTIITEPKEGEFAYWIPNQEDTCLRYLDIIAYGKGKTLYGWHISDLKIYDKPKKLSEFISSKPKNKFKAHGDNLTRPPQSWIYVEEQK